MNQLKGSDFFAARTHIGLSIAAVSRLTKIHRNTLSNFEREKGTLNRQDKETLMNVYQERGYQFGQPEQVASPNIDDHYQDASDTFEADIEQAKANGVKSATVSLDSLTDFVSAVKDMATVCHLQAKSEAEPTSDNTSLVIRLSEQDNLDVQGTIKAYQDGESVLLEHFLRDKNGETKKEIPWSDDGIDRASILVSAMAVQYLRLMTMQYGDIVPLGSDEHTDSFGVDANNVVKVIAECFGRSSLELEGFTATQFGG